MDEKTVSDIESIKKNIQDATLYGLSVYLVRKSKKDGFNYPFILCFPNENMGSTLVVNPLNDYEEPFLDGESENLSAISEIYGLFEDRVFSLEEEDTEEGKIQEEKEKSISRLAYRINRATNSLSNVVRAFKTAPIIMPLIPGFTEGEKIDAVKSEIGAEVAEEMVPQISSMIEKAKAIIQEKTEILVDSKVLLYGHSKESTFADHLSALDAKDTKGIIIGGTQDFVLPIEEIRLIIDDARKENEDFFIKDGSVYKKVTSEELRKIVEEYNKNKKDFQREIVQNEDGSYALPLNFPKGIADIDRYIKFESEEEKREYIEKFKKIPRMIFNGEDEEQVEGHFAYFGGTIQDTLEKVEDGEDLSSLNQNRHIYEIEHASMHNRVLEYVAVSTILFGRSANERLNSYLKLCDMLGMSVKQKIYKGVRT